MKKHLRNFNLILQEIKSNAAISTFLFMSTILLGVTPILGQYMFKLIVQILVEFFQSQNEDISLKLIFIIAIYALTTALRELFNNMQLFFNRIMCFNVIHNIKGKFLNKIKNIKYGMLYFPSFQNLYSFLLVNISKGPNEVLFAIWKFLPELIHLFCVLFVVLKLNVFVFFSLTIMFILDVLAKIKTENEYLKNEEALSLENRKTDYCFNILTGKKFIKEIRIFGLENYFLKIRNIAFGKFLNSWNKIKKIFIKLNIITSILYGITIFFIIRWLVVRAIEGYLSVSDVVFYSGILLSIYDLTDALAAYFSRFAVGMVFVNKFVSFLDLKCDIYSSGSKIVDIDKNHIIEFKNISFKYPLQDDYTLKDINFKIYTGEKVALVGKNGCGKTSIINLILRIYDPTEGEILLDGINIKEYDYEKYLKLFATVLQDYQQFSMSLYDYILSGKDTNISKVKNATKDVMADEFIEKASEKWNSDLTTRFNKKGLELSGGQWQKLAIARAFCTGAPMLILDEATSALDAISESMIYGKLEEAANKKLVIFVSHRMYFSKIATKIIYIENGEIKNIGTHNELMKNSFGYKELFEEQANRY